MPSHFMPILIHSYSSKSNNNTAPRKTHIISDWTVMGDNKNQRFVSKFEEISVSVISKAEILGLP